MSEGQPTPQSEIPKTPEAEAQEAITPAIAHIAFGAIKTELLKPEVQQVTPEQKVALQSATPDTLKPLIDAGNAVSMDSRNAAEQMENKDWNVAIWNSLQSFTAEGVAAPLREERLKALAALEIKLDVDQKDANGLNTQVEAFRIKYVDYDKSNIGQFITDVSKDCKRSDGSTDITALEKRLTAIEPMLSIFGSDPDVALLIKDFARTQGILNQTESVKKTAVDKAALELNRPIYGAEQTRVQKLWDKMPPDETGVSQETQDDPETQPLSKKKRERGQRIKALDGAYYTVMSSPDSNILVLRSDGTDDKKLVSHDEAEKILREAERDTVQVGMSVVRRDDGKEYVVERVHRPEKGGPVVHLKNPDGSQVTIAINDFREKIQTEGSPWRISEPKVKDEATKEKVADEPLTPEPPKLPEPPAPPEQTPTGVETVRLTDARDMSQEMKDALRRTARQEITFESAPDVLLPFLQTKIAESANILEPLSGTIVDNADPSKRELVLKGKVSKGGTTATFNVTLQNTDTGLQIVRKPGDIVSEGWTSAIGHGKIEAKLAEIDDLLKTQINNELAGLGSVQKVQIGEGVLACDVKKS